MTAEEVREIVREELGRSNPREAIFRFRHMYRKPRFPSLQDAQRATGVSASTLHRWETKLVDIPQDRSHEVATLAGLLGLTEREYRDGCKHEENRK